MENLDEFKIPERARKLLQDPKQLQKEISEGKTWQDIMGFSESTMHKFYDAACRLYQRQEYDAASDAFTFLTTLNPCTYNYWLGLGMSEHLNQEYFCALIAYDMAAQVDPKNPLPDYHSASCHMNLHDHQNALVSLEMVLSKTENQDHFESLREQALLIKKSLLQKPNY